MTTPITDIPPIYDLADRLHVAIPCFNGQAHVSTMLSVMAAKEQAVADFHNDGAASKTTIIGSIAFLSNISNIDLARNKLTDQFLRGGLSRLLFVDSDVDFKPEDLVRVWQHAMKHPRAIICGTYPKKEVGFKETFKVMPGAQVDSDTGLIKAAFAPTGFMCIPRQLFNDLRAAGDAPASVFPADGAHPQTSIHIYFQSGLLKIEGKPAVWCGEDYHLCARARAIGYDILVDQSIQLGHWGTVRFPIKPQDIFAEARRLRASGHPACPEELI